MRTATLVLLLAASLAAQQGSIDGVVLNQASGQPLSGVHVRLFAALSIEIATQAYGATTAADGRFSVAAMPPGTYTVELERTGFLQVPGNGFMRHTEIELRPGEHLAGRQFAMSPLILIAGRVVNQYGDPVPGVRMEASTGAANSFDVAGPFSQKNTDERGQFRLFAPPGKYYLVAGPQFSLGAIGLAEIRTDGISDLAYASTYYPNSPDLNSATAVEVKPGSEVTGIEIRLRSDAPRRNLTVSGVVAGVPQGAQATVSYRYGASPGQFSMGNGARVGADGRFSFDNLPPGYLRLLAQCSSGNTELQSELVDIHLEPPGATDVLLALTSGGVVGGTLEIVGGDASAAPAGELTIRLSAIEFGWSQQPLSGAVDQSGAFRIAGVPPGRFRLDVDAMPENAYIRALLVDNAAVSDGTLDFSRGVRGQRVKVTISRNGAQISGEVRAADGGPLLNPRVAVFLAPEPNQIAPGRSAAQVVDGQYVFKGVPPGKYKVYAADPTQMNFAGGSGGPDGDPRRALLAAAETLEVTEGGRVAKNLKAIARETPNVQPKQ